MKRRSRARKAARRLKVGKRKVRAGKARGAHRKASRKAVRHSARKTKPSRMRRASARKRIARSSKKPGRRTSPSSAKKASQSMMFEPLEQVTVACSNCGRQFNIVKLHGLSMEGMICQRCSIGEVEFPEQ